jgi:hypothetical protein
MSTTRLLAVVFWLLPVLALPGVSAFAQDKPPQEPAELAKARKDYQAEVKAAVDPITAAYLAKLDAMMKAFGAKGDLQSALAIQNEIRSLATTTTKAAPTIVGRWTWYGMTIEFTQDGTAKLSNGDVGKWKCIDKKAGKYEASWPGDGGRASIVLSADGDTIACRDLRLRNGPISYGQRVRRPWLGKP